MNKVIVSKDLQWDLVDIYEGKFQLKRETKNNTHGLFANKNFKVNEVIFKFNAKDIVDKPTYLTVQLDDNKHFSLDPDFLQYMNHGCDPNIFMDTTNFCLIALKDISSGDEFSFFYPSTEWDMDQAFICNCGSENCHGFIAGAHSLKPEILNNYRINEYIKRKLSEPQQTI